MKTEKSAKPAQHVEQTGLMANAAFVGLVLQTTATVLTMKYSRSEKPEGSAPLFATTVAVIMAEFFKMWVGVFVVLYNGCKKGNACDYLYEEVLGDTRALLHMAVPATLYAVQNNLLFIALHNLDSAVYQVTYQLKTFMTAIVSYFLLGRTYGSQEKLAMVLLCLGVLTANYTSVDPSKIASVRQVGKTYDEKNTAVGLIACICGTITSGVAGVYLEKHLRNNRRDIYTRNVQLGMFGTIASLLNLVAFSKDFENVVVPYGFFHGFTKSAWAVVALNTLGGYFVATVVKYTSNVYKAFATGISVILGAIGAVFLFNFTLEPLFVAAVVMVLGANELYRRGRPKSNTPQTPQTKNPSEEVELMQNARQDSAEKPRS